MGPEGTQGEKTLVLLQEGMRQGKEAERADLDPAWSTPNNAQ